MSKYEPRQTRRTLVLSCLCSLALCTATLFQTGCIFDRCSNWYIGFTPGCNSCGGSCGHGAKATAAASQPAPSGYTYDDGVAVGRQYARNFGLTYLIDPNDPLPKEIDGAGLGETFDKGVRDGINLQVRELAEKSVAATETSDDESSSLIIEAPGQETASPENVVHPDYEPRDETPVQMFVRKSELQLPPVTPTGEKSLEKDLEANVLSDVNAGPQVDHAIPGAAANDAIQSDAIQAAEEMFANSQPLEASEPQVEATPLQSATMDPAEASPLTNDTRSARPARKQPLVLQALPMQDSKKVTNHLRGEAESGETTDKAQKDNPNGNTNDFIPSKTRSVTASNKTEVEKPRKIILRAKPVPFRKPAPTESEPETVEEPAPAEQQEYVAPIESEKAPATEAEPIVEPTTTEPAGADDAISDGVADQSDEVIRLIAKPNEQSIIPPASNKQTADSQPKATAPEKTPKNETSVLVDHLDGVGIVLDPVPTLRAKTFTTPNTKSSQTPAINASYRFPSKSGGNGIAPKKPVEEKAPATESSAPADQPVGERLPAVGPDLEKMMKSPFDSDPATSSPTEEPRRAEEEAADDQKYR